MMIFIAIIKVIIIVTQIVSLIGVMGSDHHHFHHHNYYNHDCYGHDDHHPCVTNSGSNWGDGEGTGRSEKVPRGNSTHLASTRSSSPRVENDDQPMILSSVGSKI